MRISRVIELIEKLDTPSDRAAEKVISRLAEIGKIAVPALIAAANNDRTPRVRKWSLQALGLIGDRRAAALLLKALDEPRMTIRLHALKGLRRMKYKKGIQKIVTLLNDDSGGIRVNALYCLIEMGDQTIFPHLKECLNDPRWYVRQTACLAYAQLGAKSAKIKLSRLAKTDDRKAVRDAAIFALSKIESSSSEAADEGNKEIGHF